MQLKQVTHQLRMFLRLAGKAAAVFLQHDPLRLASSTAFFTVFALPPILIILIRIFGSIFSTAIISGELFRKLSQLFGTATSEMVRHILLNMQDIGKSRFYLFAGSLFLLFVSTTLFIVVQRSINDIWGIRIRSEHPRSLVFRDRFRSFCIILLTGLLFIVAVLSDTLLAYLGRYLQQHIPALHILLLRLAHVLVSLGLVTVWFAVLFRYLPNARARSRPVWAGALVTGVLFTLGKYIMNLLLLNSRLSSVYDTAGSVMLVLLFVFYSAMILFYGAAFVKVYSDYGRLRIEPKVYATRYYVGDLK